MDDSGAVNRPNPYLVAVFTALLSAVFAIIGFYFTAKLQAENVIIQKQYEYKATAYSAFLSSINKNTSPVIAEILSAGELSKHVVTDEDIQSLEDKFGRLAALNYEYKISLRFDSEFNILQLHGSEIVRRYCEDILSVLALREQSVNWNDYSKEITQLRDRWLAIQINGIAYGWEEKVSDEERVMYVLLSALYKNLLTQLRTEIYSEST